MRITPTLLRVASVLIATGYGFACGGSQILQAQDGGGEDASTTDASMSDAGAPCANPCTCANPPPAPTVTLTANQACALVTNEINPGDISASGPICHGYCADAGFICGLPLDYANEFVDLNLDAGTTDDGGPNVVCPPDAGSVIVSCYAYDCTGRLTEGHRAPQRKGALSAHRFAAMAYLEAVSVHAFARLGHELRAHGAPASLVRDARRAMRDERRHSTVMTALARRGGVTPEMLCASSGEEIRSLFEVALENAVEGCVRETYGAVMGLVEAKRGADQDTRRALHAVAADECRHAELAWAVHRWVIPRLSNAQAAQIRSAMNQAMQEIALRDSRSAQLLFQNAALMELAAA
jgi:hypothetical protein